MTRIRSATAPCQFVQSGPNSHLDWNWMEPSLARFIRRMASFSRMILYDNRGVGLSDPVPGGAAGAQIRLESRGTHQLKGVPGSWEVFAVVS